MAKLLDVFFDGNAPKTKSGWGSAPQYFPILDDRMLVYSYVAFPEDARKIDPKSRDVFFSHFLYVDNPDSDYRYDPNFLKHLMEKQRYARWDHLDTRIGSTRYSTVFQYFGHYDFLYRPFVSMYYQMFLLITYYRARLIRFSDEVAVIARDFHPEDSNSKDLSAEFKTDLRTLHTRFMRFMNIDWFTEVTNQDQGIEIFKLMREEFELESMYSEVKDEIERADELAELIHNQKVERFNKKVGHVGIIIGLLAVITGFFGMNFGILEGFCKNGWVFWPTTVVLITLFLCGVYFIKRK